MKLVVEKRDDGDSFLRTDDSKASGARIYVAQGMAGNRILEQLAHRYNHFDRLLALLKAGVADFEKPDVNASITWADKAKALLTEMEDVK